MRLEVEIGGEKKLLRQLESLNKRAVPFAVRSALNTVAFEAQTLARKHIKQKFIVRNQWTYRNVQVQKATGLNIDTMFSSMGSTEQYMKDQELGNSAVKSKNSKKGHPIPTPYASGESSVPRQKLPRGAMRRKNIKLKKKARPAGRKARNAAAIREAAKRGGRNRFVWLEMSGHKKGVYKVIGPKSKTRIKKVLDMSRKTVRIQKRPWIEAPSKLALKKTEKEFAKALMFQIARI